MPTAIEDAKTGGSALVFAEEMQGTEFRLSEASVYKADEVRDEIGEDYPEFGRWIPVEIDGKDQWLMAPGELVDELKRLEASEGPTFRVTRAEKSGPEETDPWEVNVEVSRNDQQTSL